MPNNPKLGEFLTYKICTKNCTEPLGQQQIINELCEIAELEFLTNIPKVIGIQTINTYLKNICQKHNVEFDIVYLRKRWKKLFRTKVYKRIDSHVTRDIFRRDKHKCQYCNRTSGLEIHHVIPRDNKRYRGPDSYFNLVLACKDCNLEILNTIVLPQNWWQLHFDSKYASDFKHIQ